MPTKPIRYALLLLGILLVGPLQGKLPPPPVNQYLGIPDVRYTDMDFRVCLGCHGDPQTPGSPIKTGYLPDRHHLRVGTPIGPYSASPYPEKSPDGNHHCITCHLVDWIADRSRPEGGYFHFSSDPEFRDCLRCHTQKKNSNGELLATVHHLTEKAQRAECHTCHGNLVDNPNGDHRIPDPANHPDDPTHHYDISLTTPWPGTGFYQSRVQLRDALRASLAYKLQLPPSPTEEQLRRKAEAEAGIEFFLSHFDPPLGENGRPMGNCAYCHFAGYDELSALHINTNYANHHGTGVGQPGSGSVHSCSLCHRPQAPPAFTIRGCERCHGIKSLHGIEYDAMGDGIRIGEEPPYFGHIGNQKNCDGCHRNSPDTLIAASNPGVSGAPSIIPSLESVDPSVVPEEESVQLLITGSGFESSPDSHSGTEGDSIWLRLIRLRDETFDIIPTVRSPTHMTVTLPSSLPAGSYRLTIVKNAGGNTFQSRHVSFLVKPVVRIDGIECDGKQLVVRGKGFGHYLAAEGSGTMILSGEPGRPCSVSSWSTNEIHANCAAPVRGKVHVKGLFGAATWASRCSPGPTPSWWEIWSWWSSWSWSRR